MKSNKSNYDTWFAPARSARTCAALLLACALAGACIPAAAVAAEDAGAAQPPMLTRTVTWQSTEQQPAFPESIDDQGTTFYLIGTTIEEVSAEQLSVPAQRSSTVSCAPENLESTRQSFPETLEVTENGFAGVLALAEVTQEPVYAQRSWEVNEVRSFAGLPNNDAAQINADLAFTNPETQHGLQLRLASLSWSVDSLDDQGLPATYTASALYRGTDTADLLDYYRVTARYEGSVPAPERAVTYQATLAYQAPPAQAALEEQSEQESNPAALVAAAVAAAAAAAAAIGVFFWRRSRDVRVCRVQGQKLKVVARVSSQRAKDGSLVVEIPANIDICAAAYALMIAPHKADGAVLKVLWCGKLAATARAQKVVQLTGVVQGAA